MNGNTITPGLQKVAGREYRVKLGRKAGKDYYDWLKKKKKIDYAVMHVSNLYSLKKSDALAFKIL